ncbi:MAG: DmsE family decaheme c-type cytochrome [Actinomycetota bacterium]
MKLHHWILAACVAAGLALGNGAMAADNAKPAKPAPKDLILKGDAKCTGCHDESDEPTPSMLDLHPSVLAIGKTRHGTKADGRTPTCTDCHGDSEKHMNYKGSEKPPKPDRWFSGKTKTDVEARNGACLSCHEDAKRANWRASKHAGQDVACTSCHSVHAAKDKVRDKRSQPQVCFTCHKEQRAQADKPSHHPIPEGKMTCSDCHNPHGSTGPKALIKDSVNATCYTCHAEKRGPFVHNHPPVAEDCANCHNPHGTIADSLLKTRPPFLCLQCHDTASHPGNLPGIAPQVNTRTTIGGVNSGTTPTNNFNANTSVGVTQGRACLNCHTEIHGSNSPANASKAMRFWR